MLATDMVFLCLPTLYSYDDNSYDKTALHEICAKLSENEYRGLVVIKSTVEPTTTQTFADTYKLAFFHNPEFLTARTAYQDFHDQKHIIIGKSSDASSEQLDKLVNFYRYYYPDAKISTCHCTESECTKIFCNCFYAVKVQFFNELYLLCQKLGMDYNTIRNTMLKNGWINPMHTDVPGPDGELSYGGMCFPKDTNALLSFMKSMDLPHAVLDGTVSERNSIRSDK
jgi:UDPglucose 6-dehydrogenase